MLRKGLFTLIILFFICVSFFPSVSCLHLSYFTCSLKLVSKFLHITAIEKGKHCAIWKIYTLTRCILHVVLKGKWMKEQMNEWNNADPIFTIKLLMQKWPMRTRLYAGIMASTQEITKATYSKAHLYWLASTGFFFYLQSMLGHWACLSTINQAWRRDWTSVIWWHRWLEICWFQ